MSIVDPAEGLTSSSMKSGTFSTSTALSSMTPFSEEPSRAQTGSVLPVTSVTVVTRPDLEEATRRERQERNKVLALAWVWGMLPGVLAGAALTYSLWSAGTPITKATEASSKSPVATSSTQSHTTVPPPLSTTTPAPATSHSPLPTVPTVSTPTTKRTVPIRPTPPTRPMVSTTSSTRPTAPTRPTVTTRSTVPTTPVPQPTVPRATFYPGGPRLASEYLNVTLTWTISPCADFFGFVCSHFVGPYTNVLSTAEEFLKSASKALLFTIRVPPRNQSALEKAAGLFQACIQLANNATGNEAAALRSFLRPAGLDISNMALDPKFSALEAMMQLSMEFGFPCLVCFGVIRTAYQPKKELEFVDTMVLSQMQIHEEDEKWMNETHQRHSKTGGLDKHYEKYLKYYDPKLNFTNLATRIIAAEKECEREAVLSDAVKRRVTENVLNWCTKVRAVKRVKRARVVEAVVEGVVTHAVRRQRLRLVRRSRSQRALGLPQCALYQNRAVAQARNVLVQQESAVRRSSWKHVRLRCRGVPGEQRTPRVEPHRGSALHRGRRLRRQYRRGPRCGLVLGRPGRLGPGGRRCRRRGHVRAAARQLGQDLWLFRLNDPGGHQRCEDWGWPKPPVRRRVSTQVPAAAPRAEG
ncbi:hypothetical protein MRX96_011206 [Rhipicephalus microplus]